MINKLICFVKNTVIVKIYPNCKTVLRAVICRPCNIGTLNKFCCNTTFRKISISSFTTTRIFVYKIFHIKIINGIVPFITIAVTGNAIFWQFTCCKCKSFTICCSSVFVTSNNFPKICCIYVK